MSKTLDKISKLLAKAENAGTPEEAAAFMAKVQELASINNVDLAVARMHQAKKERVQEPEQRRIQANPFNRRHNRKHFIELCMAICDVNDVKYLIGGGEYSLHCVGFPSDLDVVEALYAHLSAQMATECDEALARGDNKQVRRLPKMERIDIPFEERAWGDWNGRTYYDPHPEEIGWGGWDEERYEEAIRDGEKIETGRDQWGNTVYRKPVPPPKYREVPVLDDDGHPLFEEKVVSGVDGRVFRNEFYASFVRRMRGRLWEARKSVERERGVEDATSETALALRDKKDEVTKAHEARYDVNHVGVYKGSYEDNRKMDRTGLGAESGHRAAEVVPLGDTGRAVPKK